MRCELIDYSVKINNGFKLCGRKVLILFVRILDWRNPNYDLVFMLKKVAVLKSGFRLHFILVV